MVRRSSSYQAGSAFAVVAVCVVVALLAALGWVFWQNFMHKNTSNDTNTSVVDRNQATISTGTEKYVDLRQNSKDGTGLKIMQASDINKLDGASAKLKSYFSNVGTKLDIPDAPATTLDYTVDRVDGDYGAGAQSDTNAYVIWGPKDGTGPIEKVAMTQNLGMACDDLRAAKVPSQLVDGKCLASDGSGLMTYAN